MQAGDRARSMAKSIGARPPLLEALSAEKRLAPRQHLARNLRQRLRLQIAH